MNGDQQPLQKRRWIRFPFRCVGIIICLIAIHRIGFELGERQAHETIQDHWASWTESKGKSPDTEISQNAMDTSSQIPDDPFTEPIDLFDSTVDNPFAD